MHLLAEPSFGAALRSLRQQQGLSLAGLSQRVHYSKSYLSKVENGERSATAELARCCDQALGALGALAVLAPERPARRAARASPGSTPAQLPPGAPALVGRAAELERLDAASAGQTSMVTVIVGPPGVGKTALALHWAHLAAGRFPDGCLFANLHGFDPGGTPAEPAAVLDGFLRVLVTADDTPADLESRSALFRTLLHGRRMLVVLDNAAAPDQVRPLLPGGPGSHALVTSRSRLSGLVAREAAARILLDPLGGDEAITLLSQAIGAQRAAAEPQAAAEIAARCGHLPLALRIAADRAQSRPRHSLAELASQLAAEHDRLDVLDTGDGACTAVRSVFFWSYNALPPEAARMFRLLGLHPGPDLSVRVAAALAGTIPAHAGRLLESLSDVHLLEEVPGRRFRFHDLLRLFAAERARAEEPEHDRLAATARMLSFYLRSADAADRVLMPHRRHLELGPAEPSCQPMPLTGYSQALAWCDVEHANLLAAVRLAAATGDHVTARQLPAALWSFFNLRKPWDEWITACEIGLASARAAMDRIAQAQMLTSLGSAHGDLGDLPAAFRYFGQALAIRREVGDQQGIGSCLLNIGNAACIMGRFEEAEGYYRQALDVFALIGDRFRTSMALNGLGEACRGLARYEDAIDCFRQALVVARELADQYNEADTMHNIGGLHHRLRELGPAVNWLERALTIRREIGDRGGEADTLRELGDVYRDAGRPDDAERARSLAAAVYDDLHNRASSRALISARASGG